MARTVEVKRILIEMWSDDYNMVGCRCSSRYYKEWNLFIERLRQRKMVYM